MWRLPSRQSDFFCGEFDHDHQHRNSYFAGPLGALAEPPESGFAGEIAGRVGRRLQPAARERHHRRCQRKRLHGRRVGASSLEPVRPVDPSPERQERRGEGCVARPRGLGCGT